MPGVFQNIDPPPHPPSPPGEWVPLVRGGTHSLGGEGGGGVNILEDARHSSELYVCKYFVSLTQMQPTVNKLRSCFGQLTPLHCQTSEKKVKKHEKFIC
jgi:hypothetical protein